MTTLATVAAQAAALVAAQVERDGFLTAWLLGPSDGGPNGDGHYPLPDGTGGSTSVPGWQLISNSLVGPAGQARSAAEAADASREDVQAVQAAVETAQALIEALLVEARNLRSETEARYLDAAAEHAAARAERESCEQIQSQVQALYDEWSAAQP